MVGSCAMAHLKGLFIAFVLYLTPILSYDTHYVIYTIKMKSPTKRICQHNSPFQKMEEIWIVKRSAFMMPTVCLSASWEVDAERTTFRWTRSPFV